MIIISVHAHLLINSLWLGILRNSCRLLTLWDVETHRDAFKPSCLRTPTPYSQMPDLKTKLTQSQKLVELFKLGPYVL